jgi:hypothetical protein
LRCNGHGHGALGESHRGRHGVGWPSVLTIWDLGDQMMPFVFLLLVKLSWENHSIDAENRT